MEPLRSQLYAYPVRLKPGEDLVCIALFWSIFSLDFFISLMLNRSTPCGRW